ncbi:hypothetical protein [Hydrogenophaga sp. MI9]|uniref:hypothetical protein n=1 Tax=Hydrogenophaga sp. MI9 TaxID=3453719 RepID=UPI003EEDAA4B
MTTNDLLARNRVILCHFDSYSHALLFPRWAHGMLWPAALPEGAEPMPAPVEPLTGHEVEAVKQALITATGLNPDELAVTEGFVAWFLAPDGPVRVHLLHFTTPDAPKPAIEALGGKFMAMSQLRGSSMTELLLLRQVFGLFGHV